MRMIGESFFCHMPHQSPWKNGGNLNLTKEISWHFFLSLRTYNWIIWSNLCFAQSAFPCPKLTIGVVLVSLLLIGTYFTPCSSVSIVNSEQVNAGWVYDFFGLLQSRDTIKRLDYHASSVMSTYLLVTI